MKEKRVEVKVYGKLNQERVKQFLEESNYFNSKNIEEVVKNEKQTIKNENARAWQRWF